MANIIEGIQEEIERLTKWHLPAYDEIGVAGQFGKAMIEDAIVEANAAVAAGDTVAMVQSYERLKGCE